MKSYYPTSAERPERRREHRFQQAATDEIAMVSAWLWAPVRQRLEWLLRFGARPSAVTILEIEGGERRLPRIGTMNNPASSQHTTILGLPFPGDEAPGRPPADSVAGAPTHH